jgi:uncharacterized membrane protein YfcA
MSANLVIFFSGLLAGAMNALAGGGSFITLPALIAVGVPSVQANASSTVALFPGGAASAWAYRDNLAPVASVPLQATLLVTICGGLIGAILLMLTAIRIFDVVLPWLLLVAMLALSFGRPVGEWLRRRWRIRPAAVLVFQLVLGIYGGYFGGAVGIMMMALWGLLESRDLKSLHAPRTLLVSAANAAAVLIFIAAHAVHWHETSVMLIGAAAGGYGGAQIGRRAPSTWIRAATLFVALSITLLFFIRAYG